MSHQKDLQRCLKERTHKISHLIINRNHFFGGWYAAETWQSKFIFALCGTKLVSGLRRLKSHWLLQEWSPCVEGFFFLTIAEIPKPLWMQGYLIQAKSSVSSVEVDSSKHSSLPEAITNLPYYLWHKGFSRMVSADHTIAPSDSVHLLQTVACGFVPIKVGAQTGI